MKASIDTILHIEQARYLEALMPPSDVVAAEIERHAHTYDVPIVDPEIGLFLYIAARAAGARRILELGTATGYSGLWLARALPDEGRLVTIDVDDERQSLAQHFWADAGINQRIETICSPALDVLPTLTGPFDLLFIDAVKREYCSYVDLSLPLLRPGAVIIADNVLWKGRIARGEDDAYVRAMDDFNRYMLAHQGLDAIVLPIGDGLLYAVVK